MGVRIEDWGLRALLFASVAMSVDEILQMVAYWNVAQVVV